MIRRARRVATVDYRRVNDRTCLVLAAFLALAPLPLGSARPFMWALNAGIIFLVGAVYFFVLARGGAKLRLPLAAWLLLPLFAGIYAWLLAQMLLPADWFAAILAPQGRVAGTSVLSVDPGSTWLMLLRWLTFGILGLLVVQVAASPARARWLLELIYYCIAAYALFGLVALTQLGDPILIFRKWAYLGFATGPFVNRNSFATFLAFGLVLGTALQLSPGHKGAAKSSLWLAASAIIAVALVATQSRMGLAAAAAGILVTMLLSFRRSDLDQRMRWIIAILAFVGAIAALLLFGGGLVERLDDVGGDSGVRLTLYQQVAEMIGQRPLLGYGGGTFEAAYPLFQRPPMPSDATWDKAHNSYLALWSELGLVGGSLPLLMIAIGAVVCLRKWMVVADPLPAIAALGVVTVAAIHSMADFSLEIEAVAFIFTAVLAAGTARLRSSHAQTDRAT